MGKTRSRDEKLFGAAVLRRSLELRGDEHRAALRPVYEGVLRDLGLTDDEVSTFLGEHGARVEAALGRGKV